MLNRSPLKRFSFILLEYPIQGQKPTEEEIFQMISEVDDNDSNTIDFAEFLKVMEKQKQLAQEEVIHFVVTMDAQA